jgi:hypothetical protein
MFGMAKKATLDVRMTPDYQKTLDNGEAKRMETYEERNFLPFRYHLPYQLFP